MKKIIKSRIPTRQMEYIRRIEEATCVPFEGTSKQDAQEYINANKNDYMKMKKRKDVFMKYNW